MVAPAGAVLTDNGTHVSLHVCLSCVEWFGDRVFGGFGRATRFIGRELVRRGVRVTVVVPYRADGGPAVAEVDGMTVRQFDARLPWSAVPLYRSVRADVYHSQDTSLGFFLAMAAAPTRRHVITFRDPLDDGDWRIEQDSRGPGRLQWRLYRLYVDNPLIDSAIQKADARFCAAHFLIPKAQKKYALTCPPEFLPTPVAIPDSVQKADRPTVCFIGRWHRRKRPERFFELARRFPEVEFIAVGGGADHERSRQLHALAATAPNLHAPGVIDQFASDELSRILAKSWVLVNTSSREGLPNTFLEAAAHRSAILSHTDPDGFASRFGRCVQDGDFEAGLAWLLKDDRWRDLGERGCAHVREVFAVEPGIDAHLAAYRRALDRSRA